MRPFSVISIRFYIKFYKFYNCCLLLKLLPKFGSQKEVKLKMKNECVSWFLHLYKTVKAPESLNSTKSTQETIRKSSVCCFCSVNDNCEP